jgi:hypothetical protein
MAPPPGAGERVALGMVAFEDWSVNVTTPVGVPPLAAVMFTVNVTNWPSTLGFGDELAFIVVTMPFSTVWLMRLLWLGAKVLSPL